MLQYYDHYNGTGFGKASKTEVRQFRCPIKALMQGDANHKNRCPQTSTGETWARILRCGQLTTMSMRRS
jgi:hypothetical protein